MDLNLLVVIILYKKDLEDSIAYQTLTKASAKSFLIYDNSPVPGKTPSVHNAKIHYVSDTSNQGLSHAYNYAADYAIKHGFDWIFISDQDTFFHDGIIREYDRAVKENPDIKLFLPHVRIAVDGKYMSPVKINRYFAKLSDSAPAGIINPGNYAIINSGMMINTAAFINAGGYNEKVWLDFADFQFIERFARKYDRAFVIDLDCIQSFSDKEDTITQKIARYKNFCSSVKHYQPIKASDRFWIFLVTLKRCASLCAQSKKLTPISIFLKEYIL
ncbi:MAG: hypothetical protein HDS41_03265 [Bacteroides sp.]|nr:hypothetical protein [Bacteroides sp.]